MQVHPQIMLTGHNEHNRYVENSFNWPQDRYNWHKQAYHAIMYVDNKDNCVKIGESKQVIFHLEEKSFY